MTELLTKEKQFLKINEELDRIALTAAAPDSTRASTANGTANKPDARFLTYQKPKDLSTVSKKQGAGDAISGVLNAASTMTTIKQQCMNTTITNKTTGGDTFRMSRRSCDATNYANTQTSNQSQSIGPSTLPQYRSKTTKCDASSYSQTSNRESNSRMAPLNTSTFTIKYCNAKFVESPSLEVLVKEESSSLKSHKDASRIGSLNSLAIDDGSSTGRRSQTSTHTVATKKNISSDGLIKFLKSKIVIIEEDHERITKEMGQQKELFDKTLEHTKLVEQQRDQANAKVNALADQLAKSNKQFEEVNKQLKDRSLEYNCQQKELETTKRELKIVTQNNNNLEKRLFRASEELENVRNALAAIKNGEREQKEAARVEMEAKDKQIKSLKKQRADLLNAYKKQLFLIDNLKRQNICLEQAKMINFCEKEFSKILDWNINT